MFFSARTMDRLLAGTAICSILGLVPACTIVRHGTGGSAEESSAQKAAANEDFDAKAYVKTNWATKVEPEMAANAVDLKEILAALKKDPEAAQKKYGRRKDETAVFNFLVKGTETIKSVNTGSAAGVLELDLANPSGGGGVKLQIGPVIKSSAIRDGLEFIHFGDFTNQLDFANISKELNFYVRDNVVSGIKWTGLAGKRVAFVGAFAEDPTGAVLITPVKISVVP